MSSRKPTPLLLLCTLLSLLVGLASAAPVPRLLALEEREAYNPTILSPTGSDIYQAGSQMEVKWDATDAPTDGRTGKIVLGYLEGDSYDEHLDLDHPLATNVDYSLQALNVTLPLGLPRRSRYIIVFFGNSGNSSPEFTILEASKESSNDPSSASAPSPPPSDSTPSDPSSDSQSSNGDDGQWQDSSSPQSSSKSSSNSPSQPSDAQQTDDDVAPSRSDDTSSTSSSADEPARAEPSPEPEPADSSSTSAPSSDSAQSSDSGQSGDSAPAPADGSSANGRYDDGSYAPPKGADDGQYHPEKENDSDSVDSVNNPSSEPSNEKWW